MDLYVVFLIGLAGSVHCVGMCGGFVVALTQLDDSGRPLLRQIAYYSGKTTTYVVLGAISGAAGAIIKDLLGGFQNTLSVILGALLILLGAWLLGWFGFLRRRFRVQFNALSRPIGRLLRQGTPSAVLGLGLLNGLLPCTLVYAVLLTAAATGSPAYGALTMLVFGLATIPALVATSVTARLSRPLWRNRLNRAGGVLVIVLGLITMTRGVPGAHHLLHGSGHADHSTTEEAAHPPHH